MRYQKIVEDFFTNEECQELIKMGEAKGFELSLIKTREGDVVDTSIRNNDRVVFDDPALSEMLWNKIKDTVPKDFDGWSPCGLNERLRFYRYKEGQEFKRHVDGSFKRNETEESKITMLIYLNDDFEGGQTTFVIPFQDIQPKTGMVLLFDHRIIHLGRAVTSGVKYVLRTDVMYKKNNYEQTSFIL